MKEISGAAISVGQEAILEIPDQIRENKNTTISVGARSVIRIGTRSTTINGTFEVGEDSIVEIDEDCHLAAVHVFCQRGARIRIGKDVHFSWFSRVYAHECATLSIGDHCLIASGTFFTVSDMHPVFDAEGARINNPADCLVGRKVWVAEDAKILKGVHIEDGAIIGAGAVVTKNVPAASIVAGNPAVVVRRDITWQR